MQADHILIIRADDRGTSIEPNRVTEVGVPTGDRARDEFVVLQARGGIEEVGGTSVEVGLIVKRGSYDGDVAAD